MTSITLESIWAPSPSTTRGVSTKLSASPDGTRIAYGSGRTAVIRGIHSGGPLPILFAHAANCNVVKISPSGYYAAGGDSSGAVKIWSLDGEQQTVKFESKPLSKINDIAWDGESKRFIVVGEGREKYGAAFSFETGASIGELAGHSKTINSVAMTRGRPFKAVTASDDFSVCLHNGVPFKFGSQSRKHTRFVQSVDYSHDGTTFISAGSDGKMFAYDGKSGEEIGEFADAHKGTIFAASFSKDSKHIATSSADQTCKLWDSETRQAVQTWNFTEGSALDNQQVGNCYAGSNIVSLSFSGVLSILDPRTERPSSIIYGHQSSITALAESSSSPGTFYSGDVVGRVRKYDDQGVCADVPGNGHSGRIVGIAHLAGKVATTSYDESTKFIQDGEGFSGSSAATGALPKALASSGDLLYLATSKDVQGFQDAKQIASLSIPYAASSIAVSNVAGNELVAVGGDDSKAYLYKRTAATLEKIGVCELRNPVTALSFSPDGKSLAVGESTGKILLFSVDSQELILSRWVYQSARVASIVWNESGTHVAAASLDQSIYVYSTIKPSEVAFIKNVHAGGIAQILFSKSGKLLSCGADGAVRVHSISIE